MDITLVIGNNSWKFHDATMMETLSKRCHRQTDRQTEIAILKAAWSQLKKYTLIIHMYISSILFILYILYVHIHTIRVFILFGGGGVIIWGEFCEDIWGKRVCLLTPTLRCLSGDGVTLATPFSAVNSLAPGRPRCHFKTAICYLVLLIGFFRSSNDNAPRWMSLDLTDDKSTLVQVMAWCRQATSHYLSQCWPSSMSPYGVTRPQWVNYM